MGWRATIRSIEAEQRRARRAHASFVKFHERLAVQRQRELQERLRVERANTEAAEAEAFANYLDVLISVHKDCGHRWNWQAVQRLGRPIPPPRTSTAEHAALAIPAPVRSAQQELAAAAKLNTYVPGFFEKLMGRDVARRTELQHAVDAARARDDAAYHRACADHAARVATEAERGRRSDEERYREEVAKHETELSMWQWFVELAEGVLDRRPGAYRAAVKHLVNFDELEELGNTISLQTSGPDVVAVECIVRDKEVVPDEEVTLTARGKLTTKSMAETKRNALYQDHVCSCALRIAREVFALLPIDRVIVNVGGGILDTATGHQVQKTFVAVHFTRGKLEALNFEAIDPSDSMRNFDHRMAFKKGSGFGIVEPITLDDQWVTSS